MDAINCQVQNNPGQVMYVYVRVCVCFWAARRVCVVRDTQTTSYPDQVSRIKNIWWIKISYKILALVTIGKHYFPLYPLYAQKVF